MADLGVLTGVGFQWANAVVRTPEQARRVQAQIDACMVCCFPCQVFSRCGNCDAGSGDVVLCCLCSPCWIAATPLWWLIGAPMYCLDCMSWRKPLLLDELKRKSAETAAMVAARQPPVYTPTPTPPEP